MVPAWSKQGPGMVQKETPSTWCYGTTKSVLSLKYIRDVAWSENKDRLSLSWSGSRIRPNMVPAWSKHGPGMVPKGGHSIDMCHRPC